MRTSEITLKHPDGRVRVQAPADMPLEELLPDFLEVAAQPDRDDWTLLAADGEPYSAQLTLAQLGITDGGVVVLGSANGNRRPSPPGGATPRSDQAEAPPAVALNAPATSALASRDEEAAALRPVSARSARTLPERLSTVQRLSAASRALVTRVPLRVGEQRSHATGIPDPASFALAARVSPLARMRQAWELSNYKQLLEQQILTLHLRRCVTIAVVSPKGGVGKSTITALLGSLLAHLRRDRVVAADTNPDWGSLGRRLVPDHPVFIDDLLAGPLKDGRLAPTQLDAELGRGPDGLMVAPAPTDPDRAKQLDRDAYRTLFARLSDLVGTLVLDCGTGLDSAAAQAAVGCADQLVLVADGEPDTASLVAEAARYLEHHAPPLVLVANKLDRRSLVDVDALEREVGFARGIVRIPTNKLGAQQLHASRFSWTRPPNGWAIPIRELAALLAADWRQLEIAR